MHKTSEHDFEIFKEECIYHLREYGFGDFSFFFEHKNQKELGQINAWELGDHNDKNIVLALTKNWDSEPTEYEIRRFAFHEVNEALLDKLCLLAEKRFGVTTDDIEETRHGIIARLQYHFFDQSLKERGLSP